MTAPIRPESSGPATRGGDLAGQLLGLLRSELRKTYSTRTWWALMIPAALISLLVNALAAEGSGLSFTPALGLALALGSFSAKFAVVYGVVCASGEFRHRTITTSYLTSPGRALLVGAKAVVAALVGAIYAAVSALAGLLGALLAGGWSEGQAGPLLGVSLTAVVTFALWAALGVGVAFVVTNQLAAITGVLVYLLLVEQVLAAMGTLGDLSELESYLPGGASSAALTEMAGDDTLGGSLLGAGALPWWLALLVFAGYASVAVLAGAAAAQRHDIT